MNKLFATFKITIFALFINLPIQNIYAAEKIDSEIKIIDQYLTIQAIKGKFSGSVLIAKSTEVVKYFEKTISVHGVKYLATFSQHGFAGIWNNYGFAVWAPPPMVGHTGGTSGIDNYFGMSPENGYIIVILCNQTGSGRMDALHEIQKLLSLPITSLNL